MEKIARWIVNANRANVQQYATSLHFFPIVATASIAPAIYVAGYTQLCMITLYAGLAALALLTWIQPVMTLKPLCGAYRASLKEINSTKDSEGNGCPPITLFYPTTEKLEEVTGWLPFGDVSYLRGMAAYVHVPFIAVRDMQLTQLEAHLDAKPHPLFRRDGSQRPIFIHSHGLAGYARLYSSFLTSIAAQGAFVVAVNHTDRSAAYCRDASDDFRVPFQSGLQWTYHDREPQLRTRVEEVRHTIGEVVNGNLLRQLGLAEADVDRYVRGKPQVILMGHSFGGATVLAAAHEEEKRLRAGKDNFFTAIAGVVAHDPWCVPLWGRFTKAEARDGVEPDAALLNFSEAEATYSTPTLLHHSQEWRMDNQSWSFFTEFNEAVHAQLEKDGLLLPEQRKRIEDANERMRKAMQTDDVPTGPVDGVPAGQSEKETKDSSTTNSTDTHSSSKEAELAEDWFILHVAPETAHLSVTDMSFLSPVVFKKKYQTNRPEAPIHQWANEALRFAEIHVEKNLRL